MVILINNCSSIEVINTRPLNKNKYLLILLLLMFSFFTPIKANRILPEVKVKFANILMQRNIIMELQAELNSVINQEVSHETLFIKKSQVNKAITELYKDIEELEGLGILIKSFDEGLLDFPSKRFNEEVWLCWKIGEDKIKFWHGKNEGFMGRKPLSVKGTFNNDDLADLR
jgi:hypothetical protein